MFFETEVDKNKKVGPVKNMYDHELVIEIADPENNQDILWACLNCGFFTHDNRLFSHEECNRESNPMPQTMEEYLKEESIDSIEEDMEERDYENIDPENYTKDE